MIDLTDPNAYKPQVVVVAKGEMPLTPDFRRLIQEVEHVVICDGALGGYLCHHERLPDSVIGDGDSGSKQLLDRLRLPFIQVADQETNDLTKAICYCLERGWQEIAILGATGKREDHALGNIFLLPSFFRMGATLRMLSDYGTFLCLKGRSQVRVPVGVQLSFFALGKTPLSVSGVKYPIENRRFGELWEGTLNEATQAVVEIDSGAEPILLYVSNEIKTNRNKSTR